MFHQDLTVFGVPRLFDVNLMSQLMKRDAPSEPKSLNSKKEINEDMEEQVQTPLFTRLYPKCVYIPSDGCMAEIMLGCWNAPTYESSLFGYIQK